jgi:4-diphosphocytidyl-2-C-methyl-D-erythritol kinase
VALRLIAPAKLNLTLEVLGKRADGYHEIASVMQALDLADQVWLEEAPSLQLEVAGQRARGVPRDAASNLAYRAAVALAEDAGRRDLGARIVLEKCVPAGIGLGGGSTDAAAVLRGLNRLWRLGLDDVALSNVAARVGSDVSFFLHGGTALVTGRGEQVQPLPEPMRPLVFTLFAPSVQIEDKTRRMYSHIVPANYSDGRRTSRMAEALSQGKTPAESDYVNAFDRHIVDAAPSVGRAMAMCREAGVAVFAAGSGPGFFTPAPVESIQPDLLRRLERELDVTAIACRSLARAEALSVEETRR